MARKWPANSTAAARARSARALSASCRQPVGEVPWQRRVGVQLAQAGLIDDHVLEVSEAKEGCIVEADLGGLQEQLVPLCHVLGCPGLVEQRVRLLVAVVEVIERCPA